jgi:hypothetical protein
MDWLKGLIAAFTGGGGAGGAAAGDATQQPPPAAGGPAGTGATGSGQSPEAAAAMQHYADGAAPAAGTPSGPRFPPDMQTMYMRLLESGMDRDTAQKTLLGIQADPGGDTGAGPNAAGSTRTAPGYGPTYRPK